MHVFTVTSVLCLVFVANVSAELTIEEYMINRTCLLDKETDNSLGGKLRLNEYELIANEILMKLKDEELNSSFYNYEHYNFSRHFFAYRDQIEQSKVYQIIKSMPKGAALHVHSTLMLGPDYMLNVTYEHQDHLYVCVDDLQFQFSQDPPQRPCSVQWALLSEIRSKSSDVTALDLNIRNQFTLISDDNNFDEDINKVWARFDQVYSNIKSLISYRPVREKFIYDTLKTLYDDNVMYVEIRAGLHSLFELNGTIHGAMNMAKLYYDVTKKFKEDYPDFIGMKLILSGFRRDSLENVNKTLENARQIKKDFPDFFAGFDLVGQEDLGKPLLDYLPLLLEAKKEIDFYFHAGETNWYGSTTDENLVDAILLGSKRIGHAYALLKHPSLLAEVKKRDIALEINLISNVVLSLVRDIRNHPLAVFLALDLPVVLSSDDPGVWGADPLSHDFYIAFSGVASRKADLRLLKQLAINSIRYSSLGVKAKTKCIKIFSRKWNEFIRYVIENYSSNQDGRNLYSYDIDDYTKLYP